MRSPIEIVDACLYSLKNDRLTAIGIHDYWSAARYPPPRHRHGNLDRSS